MNLHLTTIASRLRRQPAVTVPTLVLGRDVSSVRELRRTSRRRGRRAGRAAAFGTPQAERIQDLPGRTWLARSVDRRKAEGERFVLQRGIDLKHRLKTLPGRITKQAAETKAAREEAVRCKKELAALPADRSPSHFTYVIVLGLLGSAEYPTLSSALQTFPGGGFTRKFLAIVLSGVLAVAAHYLSKCIRGVVDESQRPKQARRRFELRLLVIQVIVFLGGIVGLMTFMGLTRGESITKISILTNGLTGNPTLLGGLMLALQLLLFVIAVVVGLLHAEGEPRRTFTRRVKRAEKRERKSAKKQTVLETMKAMVQEELDALPETERLWVEREDRLLGELYARHDHAYEATEHSVLTQLLGMLLGRSLRVKEA